MNRFAGWILMLLCCAAASAWAQSPDDAYIRVYNLIQQGDTLKQGGQQSAADEKYAQALTGLMQMEKDYPQWNQKIVSYRIEYVRKQMSPTAVAAVTQPGPAVTTSGSAAAAGPPDERDGQLKALDRQLQDLRRERELLQAKLREALTVQPAPIDPREMQQAEESIRQLRAENQSLRETLAEQGDRLRRLTDTTALADAQRQLADTNVQLERQTARVAELTAQNSALENRLRKKAPPRTPDDAAALDAAQRELRTARNELNRQAAQVVELRQEKRVLDEQLRQAKEKAAKRGADPQALAQAEAALRDARNQLERQRRDWAGLQREKESLEAELTKARADAASRSTQPAQATEAARQIEDLQQRLRQAQNDLAAERQRADVLATEKATVERRVDELSRAAAASPTLAPAPVAVAAAPTAEAARPTKAERRELRAAESQIKALQKDRADLQKQMAKLHGQVEDLKLRQKGTASGDLQRQLDLARARLAAYEAKPVPYTDDELKLFQPASEPSSGTPAAASKVPQPLPAGAAPLIAEARSAFQANRLEEAEAKYTEAVKLDDRNVTLLTDLAATQLQRGRLAEAEATLNKALAEDSESAPTLTYLGLLRYRQNRLDDAVDLLSRAARVNPDAAPTQNYLGIALSAKGQRAPAEAALRRAVTLQPGYAEAHANLAIIYALQQPPFLELARWHYQKARANGYPANPEVEKVLSAPAGGPR